MGAILHIIPFSHFNEKGMWILDYKGFQYETRPIPNPRNRKYIAEITGGTTSLPVLQDGGTVVADTTDLAKYMDEKYPQPPLIPKAEPERTECLLLEDWADNAIGPYTRRWIFWYIRYKDPALGKKLFASAGLPPAMIALLWPVLIRDITKLLGANPVNARVCEESIAQELDILKVRLEGRQFLVGDRFTLADLAVCSLLSPISIAGPWKDDPRYASVFEWRTNLCQLHGRRVSPADPIPEPGERVRRGQAGAKKMLELAPA